MNSNVTANTIYSKVHYNQVRLTGLQDILATADVFEIQQLGPVYARGPFIWLDFAKL